ncbi:MAG: GIY-YIG nuclease family protein [Lysobacteraceae bacterium]|nr:MAG: GIY-YIG nuclease family protein [Xanthomonadaceae bacterium]
MPSPSAFPEPRTSSRGSGRSFVYLLPCRESDLVKIGYSSTPLQRFQTLHARWFDYFDLDAGALVELERVADARRLERALLVRHAAQRAIAPFVVPKSAAGHTEWHAGVHDDALAHVRALCADGGLELHAPLRGWLRAELGARLDRLHDWSLAMLEQAEYERFNAVDAPGGSGRPARALRDALDACAALDLPLESVLPDAVLRWHREGMRD